MKYKIWNKASPTITGVTRGTPLVDVKGRGGVIGEGRATASVATRRNCFEQLTHPSPKETPSIWQFITNKNELSAKRILPCRLQRLNPHNHCPPLLARIAYYVLQCKIRMYHYAIQYRIRTQYSEVCTSMLYSNASQYSGVCTPNAVQDGVSTL